VTFEDAMAAYGDIAKHQAWQLAQAHGFDKFTLHQEAQVWIWENLDQVGRWDAALSPPVARSKVSASIKRRLRACIQAEQQATSGAELTSFLSDGEDGDVPADRQAASPVQWGRGDEATYCDCPDGQELQAFREIMAAVERLEPDAQKLLRDVFIDGLSYSEAGKRRGLHITAVGKRVKRLIDKVREDVGIHLAESRPHEPLHSGSEGYGWQH